MKILLDTNALIDLVAPRKPHDEAIRKLCIASVFGDVQLWVSTQSYADAYYVLRKQADAASVKKALRATLDVFIVCGTYASDLRSALESEWEDIEDFMIAYSSKHIPADYLVTRDKELIRLSPIPAMTAPQLLELLEKEHGLVYDDIVGLAAPEKDTQG